MKKEKCVLQNNVILNSMFYTWRQNLFPEVKNVFAEVYGLLLKCDQLTIKSCIASFPDIATTFGHVLLQAFIWTELIIFLLCLHKQLSELNNV